MCVVVSRLSGVSPASRPVTWFQYDQMMKKSSRSLHRIFTAVSVKSYIDMHYASGKSHM